MTRLPTKLAHVRAALLLLALSSCGRDPAQAQAATGDHGGPYFGTIDVEIVNVDVWVTDGDGRPVTGLTRKDFVVLRDGQPVEVSNFYAVADGLPVIDDRPPLQPLQLPEGTEPRPRPDSEQPGAQIPGQVPDEQRLWLIVYLDNYNIDPIERNRVLPQLHEFLGRSLRAGDRAMLVTYDRSLEVRTPFTGDVDQILDTLTEVKDESGHGTIRRRRQMDTLHRIDRSDSQTEAMSYARLFAEEQMNEVGFTADALERLIETLAGLPGRKALLHVSSGVPMLAGEEMFHAVAQKYGVTDPYAEIPRHDATRTFEGITRLANAHRVVFHTLDAGGLRGFQFGAAEYAGFLNPRLRRTLDSVVPENYQAPLRLAAAETGGRALLNRNDTLTALREVVSDFRSFYSLGIASADADSGRYHRIEVKLAERRPGHRLRHRSGYRSKSADARMRESVRSALLYDHRSNPLGVVVQWGRPEPRAERNRFELPLEIRVPIEQIVLLPIDDNRYEARLELYFGVVGEDGETSDIDRAPLGIRLAEEHVEAAQGESLVHRHRLLVSGGRKKVAVAVHDIFGRDASIVTALIDASAAAADEGD